MIEIETTQLKQADPDLFDKVHKGFELVVPRIGDHVASTLYGERLGTVAVHSTFIKIGTDEGKTFYIEMLMTFTKLVRSIWPQLLKIKLYDTPEEYEAAKEKMKKESVTKHGNENFPTYQEYGDKIIFED